MSGRPPFGMEKAQGICDGCGDIVVMPPGGYYRGRFMHKQCITQAIAVDFSVEVHAPFLDGVERDLKRLLPDNDII